MASVRIRLEREEELTPDFLDLFSKLLINNTDFTVGELQEDDQVGYRHFHELLTRTSHFKHGLKSPVARGRTLSFDFLSRSNSLVLLLDLSPYMLVYNHGTRSFPLANLEEIVLNLLRNLAQKASSNPSNDYRLSVFLFSIFCKELEPVIIGQSVGQHNAELLCQFVSRSIRRSSLPLQRSPRKQNMRDILQQFLNIEQASIGIKAIVVISSFHEEEPGLLQLFTPNWYTFAFINTGGHFGSYTIDNQELLGKLMPGTYFRNKFVFKTLFLDNWEMTQLLTKRGPDKSRTVQEMFRSIIYQHDGQQSQDILEMLLRFQIVFRDIKKSKVASGGESVISTIKDNPNRVILRSYKVPADSFIYILRTKYVQGWEPVLLNFSSLVENSKFKLRLQLSPGNYLYYEASRNQNNFLISIYQNTQEQGHKDLAGNDKAEIAAVTERMDRINSYNFGNLLGQSYRLRQTKSSKSSLLFLNHQHDIVQQLCASSNEWGKYFKLKRICFRFTPQLNSVYLQEFVNEISFILGRKISHTTFVRQSESERKNQKMDEIDTSNRRVLLTRINPCGALIQLEMAFLRFSFIDMQATLDSLASKMHNRKFKWGVADRVPTLLATYYRDPQQTTVHQLFHRKWVLRTRNKHYRNLFRIYWQQVLKRTNYQQVFPKNNYQEKHYYKLMQVRTAPLPAPTVEMIAFLRVRESYERENQLHFQLAIPPSLLSILPYAKEGKSINVPELIATLMGQLRRLQEEIVKLIDTYQAIHLRLLRHATSSSPKLMGEALQKENGELYDIKLQHFRSLLSIQLREIMSKYYRQCGQKLLSLAVPSKMLMATELEKVEGDVDLNVDGQHYSFFLCTPYKFVYLHQHQGSLYYKVVNMFYEQFNAKQNEPVFLQKIQAELVANVREQTYIKDFRTFLQGNFKGGIAKIINNQHFTHMEYNTVKLQPLFSLAACTNVPDTKSVQYRRIKTAIQTFSSKLFQLISQFFPLLRINYYFQVRHDKHAPTPFNIDPAISRVDTELFMRASFIAGEGIEVDLAPSTLPDLVMRHYLDVMRGRACLGFRFYLKVKNSSQKNENSFAFLDYFTNLTEKLIRDMSFEIERVSITRRDFSPQELQFLSLETKTEVVRLELIRQDQDSIQSLCKYIAAQAMQHLLSFRKIKQNPVQFLAVVDEEPNAIFVQKSMLMRIKSGSLIEFIYRPSIFFLVEHQEGRQALQQYLQRLRNFINASRLVQQLRVLGQLPLQPYELWLNESANHPNNKIIIPKKKKNSKNPVTKYLRKANINPQPQPANLNTVSTSKMVPLSLIYRNYLPLNERIPPKESLQALKQNQVFKFNQIHNLKNTYLFPNYGAQEHIIFHFQEKEDEALLQEVAEQNNAKIPRCKKYLLYYAFCANPLVNRDAIDKVFYQQLKEAINRKLFDEVSSYLLTHSDLIQDDEEFFIRGSGVQKKESKQFRFDLPQNFYREQMLSYLQQHIQIYHYPTAFRSEADRTPIFEGSSFVESIRIVEPSNIENAKIYLDYMRELTTGKRVQSSQESIDAVSASTNFQRNRFSDFKGTQSSASMLRSVEGFFEGQASVKYEYADGHWLFNSARPGLNLAQRFGKCLYLLRLKVREDTNGHADRECQIVGGNHYFYSTWHEQSELSEYKKHLLKKNSKIIRRDSFLRSSLAFEITDYVGTLKLAETEEGFSFIVKASLAQYYLQNYFYMHYKAAVASIYMNLYYQGPKDSLSIIVPEGSECSSGSSRTVSIQQKQAATQQEIFMGLLEWRREVQAMLEQVESILFFHYRSANLLVRDIGMYFCRFLQQLLGILGELHPNEEVESLGLLVYLEEGDQKYSFWRIKLGEVEALKQKLQGRALDSNSKIGFIMTDYLQEMGAVLDSVLRKKEETITPSDRMNLLKYLRNVRAGQQSKEYWFRRSLFVSFQINYQHFSFGSYNLNPEVDRQVKEWLSAVDCWLHQKFKLLKFIKNIKENGAYDISLKTNPQRKAHSFYDLRYLAHNRDKQDSNERSTIPMYRLLVNIVFLDFPLPRKDQQQRRHPRTRYHHHCIQIKELLETLHHSPVNYSVYNSYKGNEKFILEKLGREYISILREEYSTLN